ncbi:MAG TPA: hypothetical protein VHB25_19715 [Gemmatimonadaceae bacterium]|nr:hypothetical protein [Gemmatimonadaceae bacterium]
MRSIVSLALALAIAPAVGAQAVKPATIITPAQLRHTADSLPRAASRTAQLGGGPGYTYALTQRDSTGGVERHADWTDEFVVQSGHATELTGGTIAGGKEASPGEWRGGVIKGGEKRAIGPGDVVIVPAGTPHQMLLAPGARISYLAFKIAKPKS